MSHETIYRSLFIQARGALKKELMDHLRSKRRMRRSRHSSEHGQSRGQIVDAISIRERPAEAEDRAIPGHWEGDLLSGAKNSYIATLVERHSRFLMLIKVPSKETEAVVAALSQHVRKLPATLRRSLTWDRGLEMAKHKEFTVATDVQVYFCDPQYASKERFLRYHHENAYLLTKGNPAPPAACIPDVLAWSYSGNLLHPTQKPLGILTPLIRSFSQPHDVVLDPFCGSGSTLLAAKLAGRRFLGIELDAHYCNVARDRLR